MSIYRNRRKASEFVGNLTKVGSDMMARIETCDLNGDCGYSFPHGPETRSYSMVDKNRHRVKPDHRGMPLREVYAVLASEADTDDIADNPNRLADLNPEYVNEYFESPATTAMYEERDRQTLYPEAYRAYERYTEETPWGFRWDYVCPVMYDYDWEHPAVYERYPEAFCPEENKVVCMLDGQPVYSFQADFSESSIDPQTPHAPDMILVRGAPVELA